VKLQETTHVPNMASVLHDVDEEEKEMVVRVHSEKLAVAFGVMNSVPGSTIHVIRNLRVCVDCHSVIKLISKTVSRESSERCKEISSLQGPFAFMWRLLVTNLYTRRTRPWH